MDRKSHINRRFAEAVSYLISVEKTENKSSIAEKLDIGKSKFSEILKKRMNIGLEDLSLFVEKFGFDSDWMLTGRGIMKSGDLILNEPDEKYLKIDMELLITQKKLILHQEKIISEMEEKLRKITVG